MPNWCENVVQLNKSGFDFSGMVNRIPTEGLYGQFSPVPEGLSDNETYFWCLENWGVKWDVMNADADIDGDDQIILRFDSPWEPPRQWLNHMADIGFVVSGAYWEPNMAYGGVYENMYDGPLGWTEDNCVVQGSEMYDLLSGYHLIWEGEMTNE